MSKPVVRHFEAPHASLRTYVLGFVSCLVLTVAAYVAATAHGLANGAAIIVITLLALVQLVIQLRGFLHLGVELKPRWKLAVFGLMLLIVIILVAGSWWIMQNLNYRMMMSPSQMNTYVQNQDGL